MSTTRTKPQENQSLQALLGELLEAVHQELGAAETESKDPRDTELERTVQEAMLNGSLTAYFSPARIITPAGSLPNRHLKSAWFQHARHLGLEEPCVLGFSFGRPPNEDAGPEIEEREQEVAELLARLELQTYLWSTSEKLSVFAARPSSLRFLPEDPFSESQESASGLTFQPGADPGKIGKRLRGYSGAPGVLFDPRPSRFPQLHLGGELPYRVKLRDTNTVGDGGGSCPASIARELLQLSRAPSWGDSIAFQIVALGADYSFKALVNVVPDAQWNHPDADLLLDAKSVNHQVHSVRVTVGKLLPTRHKPNRRHFYLEPMNLGEVGNRFISSEQLTERAQVIAADLDRETWQRALQKNRDAAAEFIANLEPEDNDRIDLSPLQQALQPLPGEKQGILLAYRESGNSPFGLPGLTGLAAGGPAKSWEHQLKRSRRKGEGWDYEQNRPERPTLSGIMVSGEKLLLMDPAYAGVDYPRKGYVRLIWHPRRPDQLIGIGLAKSDTLELRDAFDGMDVDGDKLQMIPLEAQQRPWVLLMRSPVSVDGGAPGCVCAGKTPPASGNWAITSTGRRENTNSPDSTGLKEENRSTRTCSRRAPTRTRRSGPPTRR